MSASFSTTSSDPPSAAWRRPAQGRAARRHGLVLAFSVLLVLQTIAAINIAVDPFGVFGLNQIGIYFNSEREFKQQGAPSFPHRALLLGNSKMAYVDPDDLEEFAFFNGAFSGAKPEEMLTFLEAHIEGLDLVALALDHRMFLTNERHQLELRKPHWSDWLRYSLSLELLGKSIEALHLRSQGVAPRYKANGARTTVELEVREYMSDGIAYWDKLERRRESYQSLNPVFSSFRIEMFLRMKKLMDDHGVAHVVYMSPLNRHEQEVIEWQGKWLSSAAYQELTAELRKIFPEFRDYSGSSYSDPEYFWPTDFKHYRPETGAAIIREMLAEIGYRPPAAPSGAANR